MNRLSVAAIPVSFWTSLAELGALNSFRARLFFGLDWIGDWIERDYWWDYYGGDWIGLGGIGMGGLGGIGKDLLG